MTNAPSPAVRAPSSTATAMSAVVPGPPRAPSRSRRASGNADGPRRPASRARRARSPAAPARSLTATATSAAARHSRRQPVARR